MFRPPHKALFAASSISVCLGLWSSSACSLALTQPDQCTDNAQCRAAFGWGSTCNDAGFCEAVDVPERCTRTYPDDFFENPDTYRDAFVIGGLFDPVSHLDSIQASTLAIKLANDEGGLEGREFAIVYCDYAETYGDGLDNEEASEQGAAWLADVLGVSAIVGPRGSGRTEAAFLAVRDRDVVVISPSATSTTLDSIDELNPTDERPGRLWRTAVPDNLQAQLIVEDIVGRGVTSLAVVHQRGSYGEGLANLIDARFSAATQGTIERHDFGDEGFAEDLAAVKNSSVEEVVFISSDLADYADFFSAASNSTSLPFFSGVGIFLPDAAFNTDLFAGASTAAQMLFPNVRGTRYPPASGAVFDAFSNEYAIEFDEQPEASSFTVHTYDATWLLMYATAWAHFNEDDGGGTSMARGLRRISDGDAVDVTKSTWSTVVSHFRNGQSVDLNGGSGSLDYDPFTEETSAPVSVWIVGGDLVPIDESAP